MTTEIDALVKRLRLSEKPPTEPAEAALIKKAADELEKLDRLLQFALEGLRSVPHSWGLDITHVRKIERDISGV